MVNYRHRIFWVLLSAASVACNKSSAPSSAKNPPKPVPAAPAQPAVSLPVAEAPRPSVARLTGATGQVRLQKVGTDFASSTAVGAEFAAGDVVITGSDGSATVRFDGNNEVTLAPNSSLLIRPEGSAQASIGAIVMRGSVKAASKGGGARLIIGTPSGLAEMSGAKGSVLEVSFDKGLTVEVGEVAVLGGNRATQKTLVQGQSLSIEGFAIPQQSTTIDGLNIAQQTTTIAGLNIAKQSTTIDGLTLAQQTTTVDGLVVPRQKRAATNALAPSAGAASDGLDLPAAAPGPAPVDAAAAAEAQLAKASQGAFVTVTAAPQACQAQASPEASLRPVVQRMNVFAGGQVRVARRGNARIRMGTSAQLRLSAGTHFALERALPDGSDARYALDSGQGQLSLRAKSRSGGGHYIKLSQTTTLIAPSVAQASADFFSEPKQSRIYLRYGQARIDGALIEAGQSFVVAGGKLLGKPEPLVAPIAAGPGQTIEIYTRGRMPAVSFVAPEAQAGKTMLVELAADREFAQLVAAEQVSRQSFGLDALPESHIFYRFNQDAHSIGSVTVLAEPDDDCAMCRHANLVQNTGKKTVVYYQQTLPAIELAWDSVPGAATYRVQVFRDGVFDHAELDETSTQTRRSLAKGKLREGHYYWIVTALNKAGRQMTGPKTNLLQVTYDNVVNKMSIRVPEAGARLSADAVDTDGYVAVGHSLSIDGRTAEVSSRGHFDETIPLKRGLNTIVYKTVASDGVQRYYTREVFRL